MIDERDANEFETEAEREREEMGVKRDVENCGVNRGGRAREIRK